jgi:Piwi domain
VLRRVFVALSRFEHTCSSYTFGSASVTCCTTTKLFVDRFQELLGEFWKKNKRLPEVLIMYRDGVSEGQFDEVRVTTASTTKFMCLCM